MITRNLNQVEWSGDWDLDALVAQNPVELAIMRAMATLRLWYRRSRNRNELRSLLGRGEGFFKDVGLSRASVYNEGRKWFWQA